MPTRLEYYKEKPERVLTDLKDPVYHENKDIKPGDNTKFLNKNVRVFSLPQVDLGKPEQVEERIQEYFEISKEYDSKPSVTGLSLALKIPRQKLYAIVTGRDMVQSPREAEKIAPESRSLIRQVYSLMDAMWEDYMLNGKINPASGIFLGKNHFGYQDTMQHVIDTTDNGRPQIDMEEMKKRYLPDTKG